MAPVVKELLKYPDHFESRVCVTAQHREMLDQVLGLFKIWPDIDLNLMQPGQTLPELTTRVLAAMTEVMKQERPDWVLVQGDTTTVMATALAAFYERIPVGHVEAGLRTKDRYNPFPEEINRRLASVLATYHFAPTQRARDALVSEGVAPERVFLTGNTIVDAVQWILRAPPSEQARRLFASLGLPISGMDAVDLFPKKVVLVTAHRRESFGTPFESLCRGLRTIAERNEDVLVIYPVHLNPKVQDPVNRILSDHPSIRLIDPLPYEPFTRLMNLSYMILTDSGGIQEEASVLGKPVLVLREVTERPEIVEAGIAKLVGTDESKILTEAERLLHHKDAYQSMAKKTELFGDGHAAERIVGILLGNGGSESKVQGLNGKWLGRSDE
ncbi:UDP-N-acetylglucosamine 2-epimerase (non-hydrolyzing) [Candidatus Bipolaricaulota bacterium]|nr:UDP-N-acetylglucosamine 2-epimerase (non-hydrolyzing) [Candidatus Bipolaricaulota bacterium]